MRKIIVVALLTVAMTAPSALARDANGSIFGTQTTARSIGQGAGHFGVGLGLGDDVTSFYGTFRYGLSRYSDGSIKLGLADPEGGSDTKFVVGADFKYQFWTFGPQSKNPFDFAIGGIFEYAGFENSTVWHLGGYLLGSYPIQVGQTKKSTISPYGRFNVRLESIDPDNPLADSESNLELGLNLGVKWDVTPTVGFLGEVQLDGNNGVFLGVDFGVM